MESSSISHQRWSSRIQWVWLSWTLISLAALFSRSSLITSARGWQVWFLQRVKGNGTFSYFDTFHSFSPMNFCYLPLFVLRLGSVALVDEHQPANKVCSIIFLYPSLLFFFPKIVAFLFIFTSIFMINQMYPGTSICQKTHWTIWGHWVYLCDSTWYFVAVVPLFSFYDTMQS